MNENNKAITTPPTFVNGVTPLNAENLNKLSTAINENKSQLDDIPTDLSISAGKAYLKKKDGTNIGQGITLPTGGDDGGVSVGNNYIAIKNTSYKEILTTQYRDKDTQTTYTITTIPYKNENGKLNKIKVGHCGNYFNDGRLITPTRFSTENNTKLCINAGVFHMTNRITMGTFIEDGKVLQEYVNMVADDGVKWNCHVLGIKDDNTLVDYPENTPSNTILGDGVKNALVGFVPILKNGAIVSNDILSKCIHYNSNHPRQVIGQLKDKTIIILTCDGRTDNEQGMKLIDCARILQLFDVVFAYSLDGGGSTSTVLKNRKVNRDIDDLGERAVPNFIYVQEDEEESKYIKNEITEGSLICKYGYSDDLRILANSVKDVNGINSTSESENRIVNFSINGTETNVQLNEGVTFTGLKSVKDEIYSKNNEVVIRNRVKVTTLNSNRFSIYAGLDTENTYGCYCVDAISDLALGSPLDNEYETEIWDETICCNFDFYRIIGDLKGKVGFNISYNNKTAYFSVPKSEVDALDGANLTVKLRTYMSNNPAVIYYPCISSSIVESKVITSIKDLNIKLLDGENVITSTNRVKPTLKFNTGFDELTSLRIMCERNDRVLSSLGQ